MRRVLVLFCMGLCLPVFAQRPKMEIGAGVGGQHLGDYRGSLEQQTKVIPFPLLIYRGKFLQADKGSLKGMFISTKRIELNISAEASLNGGSKDNKKRIGMPELDSAFELGPSFNINLSGENFTEGFSLRFPLRGVYTLSTDNASYIGYNFNPKITWRNPDIGDGWTWAVSLGGLWGSRQYHDYYYSVDAAYATEDRPYYQAQSGFSGAYFKSSLKKRKGNVFYGISLRYDNLSGAEFENSPLIETEHYYSLSFAVGWLFWQSKQR